MNFFALHTYPQGKVGPEPLVWIGPSEEIGPDGHVKASYPSRHFTASNVTAAWGYQPGKTGNYVFGAAEMFDRDDYGADYMRDTYFWNKMSPQDCDALFDRMGDVLGDVFGYARRHGIQTCLGTETPLTVPKAVKERLQAAGKDPADSAVVQAALRRHVPTHHENTSAGLLLAVDARGLDLEARPAAASRRDDGRFSSVSGGGEASRPVVQAGHVRLGAWPAENARVVRRVSAQGHGDELHQSPGGQYAGREGIREGPRAVEMGHSVAGRRSGVDHAATLGRTDAPRRGRRFEVRLQRSAGHPLAHPHSWPERLGLGPSRLGSDGLE